MAAAGEEMRFRRPEGEFDGCHHVGLTVRFRFRLLDFGELCFEFFPAFLLFFRHLVKDLFFLEFNLPFRPENQLTLKGGSFFRSGIDGLEHDCREFQTFDASCLRFGGHFELMQFIPERCGLFMLQIELFAVFDELPVRSDRHAVFRNDADEKRLQLIEIGLRDGIEFMIVALGAAD